MSYNTDKDLFDSYGKVFTLKRAREDNDKDQDPSSGLKRGTKRRKSSKEAEPLKGLKSKESRSSNSSKGTKSQPKSSDDQLDDEVALKHDWFQKPNKPPTLDRAWNKSKSIEFKPPHKWISNISKARQPPRTFNELLSILSTSQRSCKSFIELEYHFEECYKAINNRLDWHNPKGHAYLFDLSKPLPLIEDRGRQVVPVDYFINNELEYLKGGSSSRKCTTSTTRTKAAKYDNIKGIEDMVPTLWSPVKVAYNKHAVCGTFRWVPKRQRFYAYACHWKSSHDVYSKRRIIAVTRVKVMKWCDYGYMEEIEVRRDDNVLYKFTECEFPILNLRDIKDMLILLVQKKLSNLDVDDQYDLGVALRCLPNVLSFYTVSKTFIWELKDNVKTSNNARVLCNILVIFLEHHSVTKVITMKMEILLKPTLNKLLVERFNTLIGNPVKEILLKLNLPDHRSILIDSKEYIKMDVEVPGFSSLTDL
nr:hypothetical protein [Tanacetum cinerariifolium]